MKSFLKNYKKNIVTAFLVVAVVAIGTSQATPISLGTAADFAVLGGSGVTNAVAGTVINGDVGSSPTKSISGLLPADVNGILYAAAGPVVIQAKLDLVNAYNAAAGATGGVPGPAELGGATLLPGVYTYTTAASWTFGAGNLTLDANGDSSAQWIFQIGTTLVTPANANVLLIRGASANNVFWQIGSSLTLGANNTFAGNILAYTSITLAGGTLNGRALASGGAVSISGAVETINVPNHVPSVPNVPNVVGQTQADANTAITDAGLIVGTITNAYSDTVAAGLVISQNPASGTTAASGTAVDMVVSLGLPLIPDVTGQTQADADDAIVAATFTVGTETTAYSDTVAAGLVISQNPAGGTTATSGTAVDMIVSLGHKTVLVYKVTMAINPVIDYSDANGLKADVWKENLSAYVVFGVDGAYGVDDVNDTNGPTAILFGTDGTTKYRITLGGNDPNSFVNLWIFGDVNSINPFEVTNERDTVATAVGIGFGDLNATTGFYIETSLYGKNINIDIGQTEKLSVAKSLKGQVRFDRQFVEGWGAATGTLDSKLTKDANKNSRTVAATVANIQTTVLHRYTPVSVLP
jgi:hypothetical protein